MVASSYGFEGSFVSEVIVPNHSNVSESDVVRRHRERCHRMVMDNRDSARKVAHSLLRRWRVALPGDEVDSLVNLTLCEAAARYSAGQGASFITFFFYHIRGTLARNVGRLAKFGQLFVSSHALLSSDGFVTTDQSDFSSSIHEGSFHCSDLTPDKILIDHERDLVCNKALRHLDVVDREVLIRLFERGESLVDIAKSLGFSRCHISRIKRRAVSQFRSAFFALSESGNLRVAETSILPKSSKRKCAKNEIARRRGRQRRELSPALLSTRKRF